MENSMKAVESQVLQELVTQEPITAPTNHGHDPRDSTLNAQSLHTFIFASVKKKGRSFKKSSGNSGTYSLNSSRRNRNDGIPRETRTKALMNGYSRAMMVKKTLEPKTTFLNSVLSPFKIFG